ncbi:DUF3187 family protein [Kaarinaea lacus]
MRCLCGWLSRLLGQKTSLIISGLVVLSGPRLAFAELISPLSLSNYNPLVAIYGLPYIGDAEVLDHGSVNTQLMYSISSHYADDYNDSESVLLDGETARTTFIYRQGVSHDIQMSITIPYIQHHSGGLDSFINGWHETFGMPEGGRDQVENDQFRYTYRRNSQTHFDLQNPSSGMGDIRVQGAWQVEHSASEASALELSVKLPTGNSDKLHGSGAVDVAMWFKNEAQQKFLGFRGGSFYSIGALYLGNGDVLSDIVREFVGFGGLGAGVYLSDNLLFLSQLDINTAFYSSSDLVELGSYAVQLTLGGSIKLSDRGRINLGVAEDLVIDASPDVTFHVDVDWRF